MFGFSFWKSQSEKDVQNAFEDHMKTLLDQKLKMYDQITEWGDVFIRRIQAHVNKQKYLVDQTFESQVRYLDNEQRGFTETILACEENNDTEQIRQLLDQFRSLKFELATFEYPEQAVPFIHLTKDEEPEKVKRNEFDVRIIGNDKSEKTLIVKYVNDTVNNRDKHEDSSSNAIFTNTKQINAEPSTTSSINDYNHSMSNDDNRNLYVMGGDDLPEKCPVCFMIFPQNMVKRDVSQHINEHFKDD